MMDKTKATFQKYPAYKDSGEYWMGAIPEHWGIRKLKHVFKEKKKVTNPSLNCGSISFGKVIYKDDEKVPESTKASYQEVLAGEYLVNPLNLNYDLISLRIGLSNINVVVSSGYIVLKNAIELDKSYFNYLLHRYDVAYMKLLGSGVRQTISFNHIANSLLAYPPIKEQTTIANFLDEKTTKIDRAIAQKEQLIALLKERKQIIIQNAVTGKLRIVNGELRMDNGELRMDNGELSIVNSPLKMKDSGVEWIGEIPEHWEVKKSQWLFSERKERARKDDVQLTSSQKYGVIPQKEYMKIEGRRVTVVEFNREIQKHVEKGDFMISMRSFQGGLEYSEYSGCISSAYVSLIPTKKINHRFYKYLFKCQRYIEALQSTSNLVRDGQALRFENFKQVPLILIPNVDQEEIANFIEAQSAKIDQVISLQQTQIEKLKEYKATLIDSAVTGKIFVIDN